MYRIGEYTSVPRQSDNNASRKENDHPAGRIARLLAVFEGALSGHPRQIFAGTALYTVLSAIIPVNNTMILKHIQLVSMLIKR